MPQATGSSLANGDAGSAGHVSGNGAEVNDDQSKYRLVANGTGSALQDRVIGTAPSQHDATFSSQPVDIRNGNPSRTSMPVLDLMVNHYDHLSEFSNPTAALSPVHELPSPSPTMSRQTLDTAIRHVNGINSKDVASTNAASKTSEAREKHPPPTPLRSAAEVDGRDITFASSASKHALSNGVVAPAPLTLNIESSNTTTRTPSIAASPVNGNSSANANVWQLASAGRKGKKNRNNVNVTTSTARNGTPGAENLPANENERKGG